MTPEDVLGGPVRLVAGKLLENPVISLLHATRGRPDMPWRARDEWWLGRLSGKHVVEHIFSMDDDDPLLPQFAERVEKDGRSVLVVGPLATNKDALNRAYRLSTGKITVQMSDDHEPPPGWDDILVRRLTDAGGLDKPLVFGYAEPHFTPPWSGDGARLALMATRVYVEQIGGYQIYPEYISMLSDDDIAMKAALDGALVDGYDVLFPHHWHGGDEDPQRDGTYARSHRQESWDVGHATHDSRTWSLFPDSIFDDEDRTFLHEGEYLNPDAEAAKRAYAYRHQRGYGCLRNKPPAPDTFRAFYWEKRWKDARDALVEHIIKRYHLRINSGRFLAHGAVHLYNDCSRRLGETVRDTYDVDFWRSL